MPYISRAERERANWISLPELITDVARIDQCGPDDARRQISSALADGAFGPLKWEDGRPSPSLGSATAPIDMPPTRLPHSAEINWQAGTVRDDWGWIGFGRPRDRSRTRR